MSDYGIEQEVGQAVVKSEHMCVRDVKRREGTLLFQCPGTCEEPDDVPPLSDCRACWQEWAKGVLKEEK